MKEKFLRIISYAHLGLFLLILVTVIFSFLLLIKDQKVEAVGQGSNAACSTTTVTDINPSDSGAVTPFVFIYNSGTGNTVTGVCIKSGSGMFGGNQHSGLITSNSTVENGCYTIAGIGTQSLTVTRNLPGPNCQGISHLDINFTAQIAATPTPTVTPTTPTPTPTPTVTPTTPTPTPTPTPQAPGIGGPGDGGSDSLGCASRDCSGNQVAQQPQEQVLGVTTIQKQGQVLGASTIAGTGSFDSVLANLEQIFGIAMISFGTLVYGKKKTFRKRK